MSLQTSKQTQSLNSLSGSPGVHSSRTMMLAELRLLLAVCPQTASVKDYQMAVVDENVLLKKSVATRKVSFLRLKELYVLNKESLPFAALRELWYDNPSSQPCIALFLAISRDPVLKETANTILAVSIGDTVTPAIIADAVDVRFPNRYNATTLASVSRNIISSWQQAGLLQGKLHKIRTQAQSHPTSVAYALFLGYLAGLRGEALFQTLWCRLLDSPINVLQEHAIMASQLGWLEYRHMGNVTDIGFRHLLRK